MLLLTFDIAGEILLIAKRILEVDSKQFNLILNYIYIQNALSYGVCYT